jgi:regulator of replication initiation timing
MSATLNTTTTAATVLRVRLHEMTREVAALHLEERELITDLAQCAAAREGTSPLHARRRVIRDRLEELYAASAHLDELIHLH